MGHLQGGDGSLGQFSINQELPSDLVIISFQAYFLLLTWMSLQVLEDRFPFHVREIH